MSSHDRSTARWLIKREDYKIRQGHRWSIGSKSCGTTHGQRVCRTALFSGILAVRADLATHRTTKPTPPEHFLARITSRRCEETGTYPASTRPFSGYHQQLLLPLHSVRLPQLAVVAPWAVHSQLPNSLSLHFLCSAVVQG